MNDDVFKLEHGTHIVSGTPGRVFDMIQRRTFKTNHIKMLVLDEADEMLTKGFKDKIKLAQNIEAIKILVKRDELTLEGIK